MKKAALIVFVLLLVFSAGFGLGTWYAKPKKVTPIPSPYAKALPPGPPPLNLPTALEWQDFRATREKTLHDNPDLAAEYQKLLAEANKHQQDIDAATIKADPSVAPLVAKLAAMRQRSEIPLHS
jgi:hypothetical protein